MSDAKLDRARARAGSLHESSVLKATYNRESNLLILKLSDGHRGDSRRACRGLQHATKAQLSAIEILGSGTGIHWPKLSVDLYVPMLQQGITGLKPWMSEMGRRGGSASAESLLGYGRHVHLSGIVGLGSEFLIKVIYFWSFGIVCSCPSANLSSSARASRKRWASKRILSIVHASRWALVSVSIFYGDGRC
jgi:hypothetical protein